MLLDACLMVGWLVCWLVDGWLVFGWLVDAWLVDGCWLVGWLVGFPLNLDGGWVSAQSRLY